MTPAAPRSFGAQLKALREAAGYTQQELATIAELSIHAVSALERGERRRPHVETVRALSAAFDLTGPAREGFVASARAPVQTAAGDDLGGISLPLPLTALIGRDDDMQTLQRWLTDPAVRLLTLVGPGGVGKSRLALEIAHGIAADDAIRVAFVPLAGIHEPGLVTSAIGESLGLCNVTAATLPRRARVACAACQTTLVLDNFEHVLDAAPLVADLLAAAALRVVVTSRAALHVRGERQFLVAPLALDVDTATTTPADLARAPAVRLFVERVRDVQPDFRLTVANGAAIATICRRLDALPLALELAAPWLKVLTPEDLRSRLEQDSLFASAGPRDLPERQQTMNATVAWSYRLLEPKVQSVFRRLGTLPGTFPIEAACAVLGGANGSAPATDVVVEAVATLIDKCLLLRARASAPTRPLYQMLETVRAFATLELEAEGERGDALEGLARYCIGEAARVAAGLVGPAQVDWLNRVRDDLETYRAGLAWLIASNRHAEAAEVAWGLMLFWLIRGHATEGLQWYDKTLDRPSLPPRAQCRALVGGVVMLYAQADHERARTRATRALALARDGDDAEMVAYAEHLLGHVAVAEGAVDVARAHFVRSIDAFSRLAIPWGTGMGLTGLAHVAIATGHSADAEARLDEAAPILALAGPWFLLLGQYVRTVLELRRGRVDAAIASTRYSLMHIRELHDRFAFCYTLVPLAAAASLKGEDACAARILGARDAVKGRTGVTLVDPSVRDLSERTEREARARLGPERWAVAYAAGRDSSVDALLNDIDGVLAGEVRPVQTSGA